MRSNASDPLLLLQLPWASTTRPSIGLGILKSIAREESRACEVWYPNFDLAREIGVEIAESFANSRTLYGLSEHLFAVDIYGRDALASDDFLERFAEIHEHIAAEDSVRSLARNKRRLSKLRDEAIPQFLAALTERIVALAPVVVGMTATFNQAMACLAVAHRLRRACPDVRIVLGGASFDGPMGLQYHRAAKDDVDHVFLGEADESFREFLRKICEGKPTSGIAGVTWVDSDSMIRFEPGVPVMNLDAVPFPEYDDYFLEATRLEDSHGKRFIPTLMPFESSRGCWWGKIRQCSFCGVNGAGMKYRARSPERVVQHLIEAADRYSMLTFAATDLVMPRNWEPFLEKLADIDLDLDLFYEVRTSLSKRVIGLLRRAGVRKVQAGIESFSTDQLQEMNKGANVLLHVQFLRWALEGGVGVAYNLIDGFPGDQAGWYRRTSELVPLLRHLPPPTHPLQTIELHRFSPLFEQRNALELHNVVPRGDYTCNFPQGIVELDQLTYFFHHDPPDVLSGPERKALAQEIEHWISSHRDGTPKPSFTYSIGPGFLSIVDERGTTPILTSARDLYHDVLLLCDQVRSRSALARDLTHRRAGTNLNFTLDDVLAQLVSSGMLLEENGAFLTLPVCRTFRTTEDIRNYVLADTPELESGAISPMI